VQQERRWHQTIEFGLDGVKVFRALGQHQHFTALADGTSHLGSDGGSSGHIIGEVSEDVLNAGVGRHVERVVMADGGLEIIWRDLGWQALSAELRPGSIGAELQELEIAA
jgi:hypothetical protein